MSTFTAKKEQDDIHVHRAIEVITVMKYPVWMNAGAIAYKKI